MINILVENKKALIVALLLGAVSSIFASQPVEAVSGSDFKPGRIVTDATFYDSGSMTISQIQNFLDAKMPNCDTWGQQQYSTNMTRAQYAATKGVSTPFTCLKDYRMDTSSEPYQQGVCDGYTATKNQSAAEIIYYIAQSCDVSPKVILILLQKEQALLSDDWPWPIQYRSATGFACPDTAACDPAYYGFFKQVYYGTRQYKVYAAKPYDYNHLAGFNNDVRYHPKVSCGSDSVYIESQATAGLYNYTPYQPNAVALSDIYGSQDDGCSSYGNRNFWRMFNDWFGSTDYSSYLLRTVSNATVYLVVGDKKYSIGDGATVEALYPLGSVGYASDQYLNSKVDSGPLKRVIRSSDGTVYFYDAGIKLAFNSCAQVEAYGYTCGDSILLNDVQISSFVNGPRMTSAYVSAQDGKKYYVTAGSKKEVFDEASFIALTGSKPVYNRLNMYALTNLRLESPVLRDNVAIRDRITKSVYLYQGGVLSRFEDGLSTSSLAKPSFGMLDDQSLKKITAAPITVSGFVRNSVGEHFIFGINGKIKVNNSGEWSGEYFTVPDELLTSIPFEKEESGYSLIKNSSNGTVYLLESKAKRPIGSWPDVLSLESAPTITTVPDYYINKLPSNPVFIAAGTLVKTSGSATVYITDGTRSLIPMTSFSPAIEIGRITSIRVIADSNLQFYSVDSSPLSRIVVCEGVSYIGIGGKLYSQEDLSNTGYSISSFNATNLESLTCDSLSRSGAKLEKFVNVPDGTIYYLDGGKKYPISGYQKYLNLGGRSSNTIKLSPSSINMIPLGPII